MEILNQQQDRQLLLSVTKFDNIRETYQHNLKLAINYLQHLEFSTRNDNILVRLIKSMDLPYGYDIDIFTDLAIERSMQVARQFGFCTNTSHGSRSSRSIYGVNAIEYIISDESYFSIFKEYANWKEITALKVITHYNTDLSFRPKVLNETGLVVLALNIPLMLLQYKAFRQAYPGHSVNTFVSRFVLSNMLKSHVDIVMLNRLKCSFYQKPCDVSKGAYPFSINTYEHTLNDVHKYLLRVLRDKPLPYSDVLLNVPTVSGSNILTSIKPPEMLKNRYTSWLLLVAQLDTVMFVIDVLGAKGLRSNSAYIHRLQYQLLNLLSSNTLTLVDSVIYNEVIAKIEKLLSV